jgi:hypothetical protein
MPGSRKIVFSWELREKGLSGRGEGAARVSAPDSARLDFFVAGGLGAGGAAVLIGDSLRSPSGDLARRFVPSSPLLWAVLGRSAVPALPDTAVRIEGRTLRADIGAPVAWRITYYADTLKKVERVDKGRVGEWVEITDQTHVIYRNTRAHRSLQLTITRVDQVPGFDESIWVFHR